MLFKKLIIIISAVLAVFSTSTISAQTVQELQQNISNHNEKIKQLDEQISTYEKQLETVGNEKKTLQSTISSLDLNQKKLGTQIKKTETNIQSANLTIQNLSGQIGDTEEKVASNMEAVSKTLNYIYQRDDSSLIENLLNNKTLSEVLDEYKLSSDFQQKVRDQSKELQIYKSQLSNQKTSNEKEKVKLLSLKSDLSDQNQILAQNKKEKSNLLAETKNKESAYQKQLADTQAMRDELEKELEDYQSQLKFKLNPNSLPKAGSGPLAWPLDLVRVTQLFGDTDFSRSHPGAYNGNGHNGVDLAASIGTPIKTAGNGKVLGIGNTDTVCPSASYGKWVLIEHENGLTSLYAHLSLIKVSAGQAVTVGQIIGYSGNTGYSTGPHLHFGLFASAGVQIASLKSKVCSGTYTLPVAGWSAYQNPMLYLPEL
jgi:murein DD-endopeptidase MepM/ murein hydrolase activator NlpD